MKDSFFVLEKAVKIPNALLACHAVSTKGRAMGTGGEKKKMNDRETEAWGLRRAIVAPIPCDYRRKA